MKKFIILVSMLSLVCLGADKYVYVKEGKVLCGPRELPSVGVRQDNGNAVLALHGATDNVKAACGWYRVVAGLQAVGDNQVIVSTTYTVLSTTVRPVYTLGERRVYTLQDRIDAVFNSPELLELDNDAKTKAIIASLATSITNKLSGVKEEVLPVGKDGGK